MRASDFLVLSSSLVFLFSFSGCGGAVAPTGTSGDGSGTGGADSSGTSGSGTSSSGASGGTAHSNPNMPAGGGSSTGSATTCTVGSYVFCRCDDGSEGTKECLPDRSFAACSCNDLPPPPPPCSYPAANNPPGCPATYSHAYQGQPCDTLNLQCNYPGQGDGDGNGCASTAGLMCRVAPGGATSWVAVQ